MNYNRQLVVFTITVTVIMLLLSCFFTYTGVDILSFKNVNIISDVFREAPNSGSPGKNVVKNDKDHKPLPGVPLRDFEDYVRPHLIMHFGADTTRPSLPRFMQLLADLRDGKKKKVRIGWFGDSMIEGDLLTQTMRRRMQKMVGGYGVGFVAIQSITAGFRISVHHHWSGTWDEESFKNNSFKNPLFLSGHTWYSADGTVEMTDATISDTDKIQVLQKNLICGPLAQRASITVNGRAVDFTPSKKFNVIPLEEGKGHHVSVSVSNSSLPVYGISFEPVTGVVVDNFSFRGISGIELAKLDSDLLASIDEQHYYDLIVIEYGANLMFRANDKDYSWYRRNMTKTLLKLRHAMPHTEFLLICTTDRAFRYDGGWASAIGIDSIVKTQATLAYENDMAFYNMFSSMGGRGTIVAWADSTPSMANQDYVHPNHRGAEKLGNMLFEDFMKDLKKVKPVGKQN
jgi:lysophospholipase L1-like esterase